jgi:hypothetical protein
VKKNSFLNPAPLFVEIGQDSLRAVRENDRVELPLQREPDGRLTSACKSETVAALKKFLNAKGWQPRARAICAICAIGSRGVSLRRLSLPAGTKEEFHQRLLLQIEGEFPLSPDELAWGSQPLGGSPANGAAARQELLVVAVKKEVVADYEEMLRACGTEPVFTLAAMARRNLCAEPGQDFAILEIGKSQSELTVFEKGVPAGSRIIFWGGENPSGPPDARVDALAQSIKAGVAGTKLFVSGSGVSEEFAARLGNSLSNGCRCERLNVAPGGGGSAAISGLQKFSERNADPSLLIRVEQKSATATSLTAVDLKKWGLRAGVLAVALLLLPFAEALVLKPHLAKKVAAFKAEAERLKVVDRELDFLRYLKASQPPYLDALYVLSKAVQQGNRLDSLSFNSKGDVSLRGSFRDGQQVADFRTKLIDSGFFANVTVEEQVPTPDRQKVNVRISAQEKNATQLQSVSVGPTADEIAKNAKATPPGGMPSGAMPPGMMPSGMMPPGAIPMSALPPGVMPPGVSPVPPNPTPASRKETN